MREGRGAQQKNEQQERGREGMLLEVRIRSLVRISSLGKKRDWNFTANRLRNDPAAAFAQPCPRLQPLLNNKLAVPELTYGDYIFILCNDGSYFVNNLMYVLPQVRRSNIMSPLTVRQ